MEVLFRENTHPNEPTSRIVGDSLRILPIADVAVLRGNAAAGPEDRFVDCDIDLVDNDPALLNSDPSYPYPDDPISDPGSHMYEARIAAEQWRICNSYSLTIALHDSPSFPDHFDSSATFATISSRTHPAVLRAISKLGIQNVVIDEFGFNKNCPRGLVVDVCSPSPSWSSYDKYCEEQILFWRHGLSGLAANTSLLTLPLAHNLSFYRFFHAFTWEEARALNLPSIEVEKPYCPMPLQVTEYLETNEPLVALGVNWNGRNASNGAIFGAVATRVTDFAYDPTLQAIEPAQSTQMPTRDGLCRQR